MLIYKNNTVPGTNGVQISSWRDGIQAFATVGDHTPARIVVSEEEEHDAPVHFSILSDGLVAQHADPSERFGESGSVLVRLIVPSTPQPPWDVAVGVGFLNGEPYVLPTLAQLESLALLVALLTGITEVPQVWFGAGITAGPIGESRGVMAASLRGGKGGLFPVTYCILRISAGSKPDVALKGMIWVAEHTSGGSKYGFWGAGGLLVAAAFIGIGGLLLADTDSFKSLTKGRDKAKRGRHAG